VKVFLTIVIVILILRILVRYQNIRARERISQLQREHYERMNQTHNPRPDPKITVTRQPKKDDGDYIDYEEVK